MFYVVSSQDEVDRVVKSGYQSPSHAHADRVARNIRRPGGWAVREHTQGEMRDRYKIEGEEVARAEVARVRREFREHARPVRD